MDFRGSMTCLKSLRYWGRKLGLKSISLTSGLFHLGENWELVLNIYDTFLLTRILSDSRTSNVSGVRGLTISYVVECSGCSNKYSLIIMMSSTMLSESTCPKGHVSYNVPQICLN